MAAALKDVLAAESAADAQSLLDDLGYVLLETEDVTGVSAGDTVGLGGTDSPQGQNGETGADGGPSGPAHEGNRTSDDNDTWSSDDEKAEDDGDGDGTGEEAGTNDLGAKSGNRRGTGDGTKSGGTRGDRAGGSRDGNKGGKPGSTNAEGTHDRGDGKKPPQQTRLVSYVLAPTGDGSNGGTVEEVREEGDWHDLGNLGVEAWWRPRRVNEQAERSGSSNRAMQAMILRRCSPPVISL